MKTEHYSKVLKTIGPSTAAFLWYLTQCDENQSSNKIFPQGTVSVTRNEVAENTTLKRKAQMACEKKLEDSNIISIARNVNENIYTIHYKNI